ncbi:MAG: hypothetical protein M3N54_04405 [Acidobacteriota bacterium]|nr:hypothetical protein [Acidobacteriota bacterium]
MFALFSPAAQSNILGILRRILFFCGLFAVLLAAHLCHSRVLWEGEDLPLAVALQVQRGAAVYRDVWFDKPPLVPLIYLLWGAATGPVLRIAGAVYGLIACMLAYAIGTRVWSKREGLLAAGFLAFFVTFDTHSAVLPLGADLLLLVPHLAAVLLVFRKQFFWSGFAAGVGFLCNAKAVFVLGACAIFAGAGILPLLAGFALPCMAAAAWLMGTGALAPFIDQVWRWPAQYANSPVVSDPIRNGLVRTLNWMGFHAVLVIGAGLCWWRERRWQWIAWATLCYAGVVLGWRFFPRYFLLLLPCLAIAAARGFAQVRSRALLAVACVAMAVPSVRFGPRYLQLGNWDDLAMDRDSRESAKLALSLAGPGASLYVWGYRPEIFIYTGMRPATRYLESQAMTGVPADRHLTQSTVVLTAGAREARQELARSKPDVLIDGLSPFNPALAMERYVELKPWLTEYREVARTKETILYLRRR